MISRKALLCVILVLLTACTSLGEFPVNTYTTNDQDYPAVAMDAVGNFVVVWESSFQDGDWTGIYGQRFSSTGQKLGGEFLVNTTTVGNQKTPDVAMDAAGNFLVAWASPDGSNEGIWARRYDSSGAAITGEFRVNTFTSSRQLRPSIGMNDTGAFAIAWESNKPTPAQQAAHRAAWHVSARTYSSAGSPLGQEFDVTQLIHGYNPDVAMNDTGDFVVGYIRRGDSPNPPWGYYVRMRRYNANGTAKAGAAQLTGEGCAFQGIAGDGAGNTVLVWTVFNGSDVHARRYDANGNAVGAEFTANTNLVGYQGGASVARNDLGQFVIVWHSPDLIDLGQRDVFARAFNSDATPMGAEFQLNSYTADDQMFATVAMNNQGRYVAVWQSEGQDGDGYGIFAEVRMIPEPGTLSLLAVAGLVLIRRRRRSPGSGVPDEETNQ